MNNKRLAVVTFLLLFSVSGFSQQQFLDAPFGGGGGFIAGWQFANVKPLNESIIPGGWPKLSESGIFTTGGGGFAYIGFIPHLRIGGMGFGGSTSERSAPDAGGYVHEAQYAIGGGGLTVDYTFPFVRKIGISAGLIIGRGSIDIDFYRNRRNSSWNNIFGGFTSPGFGTLETYGHLSRSYWIFTPTITFDIPLTKYLAFQAGGGYQLSVGGKWKFNNDVEISDVPSDLNGNSFFIKAGIVAGFFSY